MSTSCESDAPWALSNADLLLRSCDGQYFPVDRLVLARHFQAFEDMFESGSEIGTGEEQETRDGRIVVDLAEHSVVLRNLLHLIYCMGTPTADLNSVALFDLSVVLDKYCVKSYPRVVLDRLLNLADEEPELSYIRACRLRLDEMARRAASASLRVSRLFAKIPILELNITAQQYHVLTSYRADCHQAAVSAVKDLEWMAQLLPAPPGLDYDRRCDTCYKAGPRAWISPNPAPDLNLSPASRKVLLKPRPLYVSAWLSRYLELVEAALARDTRGAVARDQQHINAIFSAESSVCCNACRTAAHALSMVDFAGGLAQEVESRVSTVQFCAIL
ncbi:unnamed protein product [Peniophora sp. CBMAI 1063]|nr:unnamed protein product [Peniophora sp. CBMAI 1063]